MKHVQTLIDMARAKAGGNEAELARRIGVPPHHPHEWRTGKRPLSGESAAALCDYLELSGADAREWVAIAMIENPKNATRADLLKRALFACWAPCVVALAGFPQNDAQASMPAPSDSVKVITENYRIFTTDSLYIMSTAWLVYWRRRLSAWIASIRSSRLTMQTA